MALTDPQTVTISAVAISLPRTSQDDESSEYTSADGLTKLSIAHSLTGGSRRRRVVRLDLAKLTADPYKPAENVRVATSMYVVFDVPPAGYTNADILAGWTGFNTLLTASSHALVSKVLGNES